MLALAACANAKWIVPGARWYDADGNIFNAHAGGLCYKVEGQVEGGGISVYSSDDLANWTSHGLALAAIQNHTYISNHNRIQRPKDIYSKETGEYHMWWHADDDSYSWLQGLATTPNIASPHIPVPSTPPSGNRSQDFGAFTDYKSGRSYALYSNGGSVQGRDVYLSRLNDSLTVTEEVTYRFPKYDFEAPAVIQTEKSYYALMSHKTGYRPNSKCSFFLSLIGPWSQPFFASPAYTRTFSTQSGFSWRIKGTKKTTSLYMISLKVVWHGVYDLNLSGNAYLQEATFGGQNVIATGIYGNDNRVTFTIEGHGEDQWVSFYHQNIDDMGFGDQPQGQPDRINGTWQLRRISSVIVMETSRRCTRYTRRIRTRGLFCPCRCFCRLGRGLTTRSED
ncbi:glycosyl hydrolase [Aspergillus nidulans var. acristatus]